MADITIQEREESPGSFRLDLPDFEAVCRVAYVKGTITEFKARTDEDSDTKSLVVKDVCSVKTDAGDFDDVPIFYHQKKSWCDENNQWGKPEDADGKAADLSSKESPARTLRGGALSFQVDDEVVVMVDENGKALWVLGQADRIPKAPLNYFKIEGPKTSDPDAADFDMGPDPLTVRVEPLDTLTNFEQNPDGLDLKLTEEVEKIYDNAKKFSQESYGYSMGNVQMKLYSGDKEAEDLGIMFLDGYALNKFTFPDPYQWIPTYDFYPWVPWLNVWKTYMNNMCQLVYGRNLKPWDNIRIMLVETDFQDTWELGRIQTWLFELGP
jgi:hypothetical protein